jgi:hypothetical protein
MRAADGADDADECQPGTMKPVKRIGLVLVAVHVLSYVFLSDWMMERKACAKYLQFTERRFQNPHNKNVNETILVSSCGYDLFRDPAIFEEYAKRSNPVHRPHQINNWDEFGGEPDFIQQVEVENYPQDVMAALLVNTDTLETRNCIVYEVCVTRSVPLLYRKVDYLYFYGYKAVNFHDIMYTNMNGAATSHYVWLPFGWAEVTGKIHTMLDDME